MIKLLPTLFATLLFAQPDWFYKLTQKSSSHYIGYGQGISNTKAKQNALNDIASQISTKIDNSFKNSTVVHNGKVEKSTQVQTSQSTQADITDYKILKSQTIDNIVYIAIEYENIANIDRFIKKLFDIDENNEKQNSYLSHTTIARDLKKKLGFNINFNLIRKDKKWFIEYQHTMQLIDKSDFSNFFKTIGSKDIKFKTNKKNNILYNGDEFYFNLKSKRDGFVSIISVYEDGTVATLIKNVPISKDVVTSIPDKDFESILEAGLIKSAEETYDLYIALFSEQEVALDSFALADEKLIKDERFKNFPTLIDYLDNKTYATIKVVTKPR